MPKSKKQQKRWDRAEEIVAKQEDKKKPKGDDYALVQHIYQGMKATKKEKARKKSKTAYLQRLQLIADTLDDKGFTKAAKLMDAIMAGEAEIVDLTSNSGDIIGLG